MAQLGEQHRCERLSVGELRSKITILRLVNNKRRPVFFAQEKKAWRPTKKRPRCWQNIGLLPFAHYNSTPPPVAQLDSAAPS